MVKPWQINTLQFIGNYFGHPLFMPLYAYGFYCLAPHKNQSFQGNWMDFTLIILMLIVFPLLIYPILRKAKKAQSIHLKNVHERLWPLGINFVLWLSVIYYFTTASPQFQADEGHNTLSLVVFFLGGAISILTALIMAILSHKSSLHMMGISGLVVHLILTDLNDSTILTESYLLFAASGLVAVFWVGIVRYKAKAHNIVELVTGFAVGGLSQVLALSLSQNL